MRPSPSRTFSAVGRLLSNYGKSEVDGGDMPIQIDNTSNFSGESVEQALRADPNFVLAHSGLADHYSVEWGDWVNLILAESCARKAVLLAPHSAAFRASTAKLKIRLLLTNKT